MAKKEEKQKAEEQTKEKEETKAEEKAKETKEETTDTEKEQPEESKEAKKKEEAKVKEEAKETKKETKDTGKEQPEQSKEAKKKEEAAQPEETKQFSSDIKKLGDKIVSLTLMQAQELADYLKQEYGIEPAAGGAVMMAGPAAGAEAEEAKEKTSFDVVLKEFGERKIQVIKEVRALTGLGLKEAKQLVDNAPKAVKEGLSKEEAEAVQRQLEDAGAVVELA